LVTVTGKPPTAVALNTNVPFLELGHSNDHDTVHAAGSTTGPSVPSVVPDLLISTVDSTGTVVGTVTGWVDDVVAVVVLDVTAPVEVGAAFDEPPHAAAPKTTAAKAIPATTPPRHRTRRSAPSLQPKQTSDPITTTVLSRPTPNGFSH